MSVRTDPQIHETRLILRAKNGEETAFGELYEIYYEKIYKFIYYRVSHKEVAEDLAEEVFVRAWTRIRKVKPDSFSAWLYAIAKNLVIDYYRQKKSDVDIEDVANVLESSQNVGEDANDAVQQEIFLRLLRQLPPDQQIIIKLKFIEDLDNAEIAELISKTEGSIRVIQHRAIAKLQQMLNQEIRLNQNNLKPKT